MILHPPEEAIKLIKIITRMEKTAFSCSCEEIIKTGLLILCQSGKVKLSVLLHIGKSLAKLHFAPTSFAKLTSDAEHDKISSAPQLAHCEVGCGVRSCIAQLLVKLFVKGWLPSARISMCHRWKKFPLQQPFRELTPNISWISLRSIQR